jgi:hypothetical protein
MRTSVRIACSLLALSLAAASAGAQIVPLRTVPVASGDQFLLLPSATMGMGGVRVAVEDSLGDAWTNPAKGALVTESAFIGSPTYYSIENGGGGRTFPMAGMFTGTTWFAGGALALQQIENDTPDDFFIASPWLDIWPPSTPRRLSDASSRNLYASGYVGLRLGSRWSVGLGLGASALDAMDGVDLLYAGSDRIEQSGGTQDIRLGVNARGDTDRLALILLHSRISMKHDVTYSDWIWDPVLMTGSWLTRVEKNEDRTRTWGAHVAWDRSLRAPGWRVGASGTVNHKSHPKIPNYEIQDIPRDPGTTWAYEAAVGFARTTGATTVGVDIVVQPIWSETWQEADSADVADSGGTLGLGDRSIENDFFFTNVVLRSGLSHDIGRTTVQAGLEVRSYAYSLEQMNRVLDAYREQDETWMEWTPTFGAVFRFSSLDLRYTGRLTTGTGRPGTAWAPEMLATANQSASDFIIAPQGPLTLQDADVITHQVSVRIPVR